MVIRLGVTGLKRLGWCTSWTCLVQWGRKGGVISVREVPLDDLTNGGFVDVFFRVW